MIQAENREVVYLKHKLRVRSWCIVCIIVGVVVIVYYMDRLNCVVLVTHSLAGTKQS